MREVQKSAFIAIVGRPNVGKSSLLNALLGEKVAIVSPRPQTTRTRITGILTEGATQLVFIDTPGLHRARNSLGEYMVRQVGSSVSDVDMAVLVTDASEPWEKLSRAETDLIAQFRKLRLPAVAVLNKIDLLKDKEQLIPMMAVLNEAYPFEQIVPLSAKTGDGVALLRELLDGAAVEGPHYFDDDMLTDQPERVIAAEILREKALCFLSEEIPHGIAVTIETMKERESAGGPILDVDAVIYCERKSHKGIIIGKGGAMLKKIASAARRAGGLPAMPGEPAMLGEGEGGLAQRGTDAAQFRLYRGAIAPAAGMAEPVKNRACAGRPQGAPAAPEPAAPPPRPPGGRSALRALPGPVEIFVRRVQKFPNITHAAGRTMSV